MRPSGFSDGRPIVRLDNDFSTLVLPAFAAL
jgi:hypothetical protein